MLKQRRLSHRLGVRSLQEDMATRKRPMASGAQTGVKVDGTITKTPRMSAAEKTLARELHFDKGVQPSDVASRDVFFFGAAIRQRLSALVLDTT